MVAACGDSITKAPRPAVVIYFNINFMTGDRQKDERTAEQVTRILVLGSANHTKLVSAYDWDKLPSNLNIADFDTVILNVAAFQNRAFAKAINIKLIPDWRQFARHIFSEGSEVIVIGSPNF